MKTARCLTSSGVGPPSWPLQPSIAHNSLSSGFRIMDWSTTSRLLVKNGEPEFVLNIISLITLLTLRNLSPLMGLNSFSNN